MITPTNLLSLTDDEQKQAVSAETHIDKAIQAAFDKDPDSKKFVISTSDIAKGSGGLTVKVRCHVVEQYSENWRIKFDEKSRQLTFAIPRKRKTKAIATAPAA